MGVRQEPTIPSRGCAVKDWWKNRVRQRPLNVNDAHIFRHDLFSNWSVYRLSIRLFLVSKVRRMNRSCASGLGCVGMFHAFKRSGDKPNPSNNSPVIFFDIQSSGIRVEHRIAPPVNFLSTRKRFVKCSIFKIMNPLLWRIDGVSLQ